ncbi:MAG: hypothetical protein AAGD38_12220, partial [Acidobacteriota bacterium]
MTPEKEQQVLETLYGRLFDIVTFTPGGDRPAEFDRQTTFVQFAGNQAVNPADYQNAFSPGNPNGDLTSAEVFSRAFNDVPEIAANYVGSGANVDNVYGNIVRGANSRSTTDPEQKKIYDKAYKYLNTTVEKEDFEGNKTTQTIPSPRFNNYLELRESYFIALSGYRTAYNNYDHSNPEDQRKWQAVEPGLRATLDSAYRRWRAADAPQIEQALAALDTTINSAVRDALAQARETMRGSELASSIGAGTTWHLSYAQPSNWCYDQGARNFTDITLKSSNLSSKSDERFRKYGGGASWRAGLWSVGGGISGEDGKKNFHMESNEFELRCKLGFVRIQRPWLNSAIFRMQNWFIDSADAGGISSGKLAGNENGL